MRSKGEAVFLLHCQAYGLPKPQSEYRFASPRRFRFDFAWPKRKIAVEIEGGIWTTGRHVRGKGYEADLVKYNLATMLGWRGFRYSTSMVDSGEARRHRSAVLERGGGGGRAVGLHVG